MTRKKAAGEAAGRSRGLALELDFLQEAGDWPATTRPAVERAAHAAAEALDWPAGRPVELSVLLTDDASIRVLNASFRDKDKPTNVLSFPNPFDVGVPGPIVLGDVVFALETIRAEAETQGKSFEAHLAHLAVHGVLHLAGFDHEDEATAREMEALERDILASLGIADPYALEEAAHG